MTELRQLRDADPAQQLGLLHLNNLHAKETSYLTEDRWHSLISGAFYAMFVDDARGFLIALDETADYDSPNFQWFKARFDRFVYVDRIVVSAAHRAQGIARQLYESLFVSSQAAGHLRVCCEVNRVPPNPGSDAFHRKMGFAELATVALRENGKTVRYLCREL